MDRSIGDCVDLSFAGEWGAEPNPSNAVVLRATDIDDAGNVTGAGAARSVPVSKLRAKQLQDGDILLEGSGGGPGKPVGRVALFEAKAHSDPAICSNFFRTLRPRRSAVNERFLWRKLGWFYTQPALLSLQQQTTGIINLKFAEYLDARIDLPAQLSEQAKIAEVLDTLDTTIRQTEAIIEKLKQVKQGLLHDLLTRGIDANGELRPPQSQAPHLYKDSPLGWVPSEWGMRSVEEVAESIVDGPFGSNLKTEHYVSVPGVRVVRLQNIGTGEYNDDDRAYVADQKALSLARNNVVAGDVLVAALGDDRHPVGRACCYPDGLQAAVNKADCFRLRPRGEVAIAEFVMWSLNGDTARRQIRRFEQGVTMQRINLGNLRRVVLVLPDLVEQKAMCQRLEAIDKTVAANESLLLKSLLQKSGLMDDLLTGRVRVTPLLAEAHPL